MSDDFCRRQQTKGETWHQHVKGHLYWRRTHTSHKMNVRVQSLVQVVCVFFYHCPHANHSCGLKGCNTLSEVPPALHGLVSLVANQQSSQTCLGLYRFFHKTQVFNSEVCSSGCNVEPTETQHNVGVENESSVECDLVLCELGVPSLRSSRSERQVCIMQRDLLAKLSRSHIFFYSYFAQSFQVN